RLPHVAHQNLGCAPGGWTQVAVDRVKAPAKGVVIGVDLLATEPVAGAEVLVGDMREAETAARLRERLGGRADVVLSDMAASATGHASTDAIRVAALCEDAHLFATEVLAPGGAFVAKALKGGSERALLDALKRDFAQVRHAKPDASRSESAEQYVVAMGWRGSAAEPPRE
ncbi:MAG: RlmE family RNA methyltransferase, partial [Pseudomonadota bacterium]